MNILQEKAGNKEKKIQWTMVTIPFFLIIMLCALFFIMPEQSNHVLEKIRFVLGDSFGLYYLAIGLFVFLLSLYLAFSDYGKIRLGGEKPEHSGFSWGAMMFTSGLAADILFYSLCEWVLYAEDPHIAQMGSIQDWSSVYPLFHWGPIPWSFYLVLASAFGFMLHVRKRNKQKFSEACRPILGNRIDCWQGRVIDLLAMFALLAGTATTFALATPLMSSALERLLPFSGGKWTTIFVLLLTCAVYTFSVAKGLHGISKLANACVYFFFALLAYVMFFGGEARYILESGFSAIGRLAQNFLGLATFTDPLRETGFAQNWTIFYWAYWIVWCVAAPFFIGSISKGRSIRQVILGGYTFGLGGTFTSFIILGNYSLGLQVTGRLDVIGIYRQAGDFYATILAILETLPLVPLVLVLLLVTMVAFYATSFDAIALVASSYTYKRLEATEEPEVWVKVFWSLMLILLPVALVFSDSTMAGLQSVSIIAAFPLGLVILLIIISFLKDAKIYMTKEKSL